MVIQFAHSKTDMRGTEEAFKRHIYANPENPTICPILALSVYLATTPTRGNTGKLFGGTNQYERFRKQLQALVNMHQLEIRGMGVDPKDIGVHSIRKGAATYVCSGTTCAPSIAAVCNRAGWTMGKVKDTYIRYESAMDEYVGRMVCGLNINSFKFSVSPPFFDSEKSVESRVQSDLRNIFPFEIATEHHLLCKFCFASLAHAKTFLIEKTGPLCLIRTNILMRNTQAIQSDFDWVLVRYAHQDDVEGFHLTGIPPHVICLVQLQSILEQMNRLHAKQLIELHSLSNTIVAEIKAELDEIYWRWRSVRE